MLDKVREALGNPGELQARVAAAEQNYAAFDDLYETLLARYPNQWLGFYGREVKAVAPTRDELLQRIDELGLPRGDVLVRYLRTTPRTLIL
jgi:hypothetical protein